MAFSISSALNSCSSIQVGLSGQADHRRPIISRSLCPPSFAKQEENDVFFECSLIGVQPAEESSNRRTLKFQLFVSSTELFTWGNTCFQLQESKFIVLIEFSSNMRKPHFLTSSAGLPFTKTMLDRSETHYNCLLLYYAVQRNCFVTLQQFPVSDNIFHPISAKINPQSFMSHFLK